MRRLSRILLGVGVAAALVMGALFAIMLSSRSDQRPPASQPATPAVVQPAGDRAEQANIEAVTQVVTGLPAAFAAGRTDGLTPTAADQFPDVRAALPARSQVSVQPETWRRTGRLGSLVVTVRRPQIAQAKSFVVVLVREPSGWKVSATYPVTA